jgi:endonuclease YncB( thermonuclease family)
VIVIARMFIAALLLLLAAFPPPLSLSSPVSAEVVIVQPATRDVTPPGVMPAPAGEGPLIREPPPPRPPPAPRWRRYALPATLDAATFRVRSVTIRIAGVTPPSATETCRLADDAAWPCGASALLAFRRFLHGRSVECFFPYEEGVADVTAPCRIGRIDLALWLLAAGWARPSDLATDVYRQAAVDARCARLGIWRGATPPEFCTAKN